MNTQYKPFIVRWANGTHSIFIGTGKWRMIDILDEQGDPSGAEAREIPPRFAGFICLDQPLGPGDAFELRGCEYFVSVEQLWGACKKKLWPEPERDTGIK